MAKDSKVIAANAAFYAAFSTGNFDEMERMWADDAAISCIHPGWPAIIGRATVIGSWRDILQNPERPQIACGSAQTIWGRSGFCRMSCQLPITVARPIMAGQPG